MTYKEFIKQVKQMDGVCVETRGKDKKHSCSIEWRIGKQTGGSCWDEGESHYHTISGEPEPEFDELDTILEYFCSQITFLQYKRICHQIIKTDEGRYDDYYGNYTDYTVKYFYLEDLYNLLCQKELI